MTDPNENDEPGEDPAIDQDADRNDPIADETEPPTAGPFNYETKDEKFADQPDTETLADDTTTETATEPTDSSDGEMFVDDGAEGEEFLFDRSAKPTAENERDGEELLGDDVVGADTSEGDSLDADPFDDDLFDDERFEDDRHGEEPLDDVFDRMEVDELDEESVWEALDADGDSVGTADPDEAEHVVDKRKYCQRCQYFTEPPETACTYESTTILEVVDADSFRVRNCPMVTQDGPSFDRRR